MEDILETTASYNTRLNNEQLKKSAQKEEPRFLSILLRDKECLADCMNSKVKPGSHGHFWDTDARFFYGLICEYHKKYGTTLTRTAVDSIMDSVEKINGITVEEEHKAKVRMYWDKVISLDSPIEDYELLKHNINNRYVQWQAYEVLKEEIENIARATSNQADVYKKAKDRMEKIEGMDLDKYISTMDMEDGMDVVIEHLRERREEPNKTRLFYTGIKGIDNMFNGFPPGAYVIISGMINGGKTTLMMNIGYNMAKLGYGVVYVSLEKEHKPFYTRLTAMHAMVDYNKIKKGGKGVDGLTDYYYGKLVEAAKDVRDNLKPNFECIQASQGVSWPKIVSEIEKLKTRMKIDVVLVDYLGCIATEKTYGTRPDLDEALLSQKIQQYGKNNHFLVMTAVQLKTPSTKEIRNKSKKATAENISNVEINTEDLSGSKMIIADADAAIGIILNSDSPPTKAYIHGIKARDDQAKLTISLDFNGKLGKISDPILEPGQITGVDQMVYNKEITEESLKSDDGLFTEDSLKEANEMEKSKELTKENPKSQIIAPVVSNAKTSVTEDDFEFLEKKTVESKPVQMSEEDEKDEKDDSEDIFGE